MSKTALQRECDRLDIKNKELYQMINQNSQKKLSLDIYNCKADTAMRLCFDHIKFLESIRADTIDGNKNRRMDLGGLENISEKSQAICNQLHALIDEQDRPTFNLYSNQKNESPCNSLQYAIFRNVPFAVAEAIVQNLIYDTKNMESRILNYFAAKIGVCNIGSVCCRLHVRAIPKKSYILIGENYEAELYLDICENTNDFNLKTSISINGKEFEVDKDRNVRFSKKEIYSGSKIYQVNAKITDMISGKSASLFGDFKYEVVDKFASITPSKMNVLYAGVNNPIELLTQSVGQDSLEVKIDNGVIFKSGGKYFAKVSSKDSQAIIRIVARGIDSKKTFRIKPIPDPIIKFGNHISGSIDLDDFMHQTKLIPSIEDFDFDVKCKISAFNLIRKPVRQEEEVVMNVGEDLKWQSLNLIAKAAKGDTYFFNDIKCKCTGDTKDRSLNDIVFSIE